MELAVGTIVEGKVTGITKFGAFVSLGGGKSGMVHISEIAHTYVNDINDHLAIGQEVRAKIIAMENGKINLSIKQCTEPPQGQSRGRTQNRGGQTRREGTNQGARSSGTRQSGSRSGSGESSSFDDMLKRFMADSDSKLSSVPQYSDHRTRRRRG